MSDQVAHASPEAIRRPPFEKRLAAPAVEDRFSQAAQ